MSFLEFIIQYKWILIFYIILASLVFINKKKFDVEAKFFYIYRTKFGLKVIDSLARFKKTIHFLGKSFAIIAFFGVFYIIYYLGTRVYEVIINPSTPGIAPVLPGLPIAGTGMAFPFIIGWISLFAIIVIHEFSHGVVAKAYNIPIKSSGIAFFGPILGAFVEPDEKKLVKEKAWVQNAVFAAGPMSNLITAAIFILILGYLLVPAADAITISDGIIVSPINGTGANEVGMPELVEIEQLNGEKIDSLMGFYDFSISLKPNQNVDILTLDGETYSLTTGVNPDNESRGYMGLLYKKAILRPKTPGFFGKVAFASVNWLSELFFWLYLISFNLGLINLFPIFITDGARMLQISSPFVLKKRAPGIWKLVNQICILMILTLIFLPVLRSLWPF